jgi:spore maturation protein CgeB
MKLNIVILGLSITSSWGNGHATTYRALAKALAGRGHSVTFLERDVPWYREHRDLTDPTYCHVRLYDDLQDIPRRYGDLITKADLTMIGSYVPDGIALADWITSHARGVTAFYDIDTPVTLAGLDAGGLDYLSPRLIPRFDLYVSFSGGPALAIIEERYGSPRARALYCSADLDLHAPLAVAQRWSLGYLGTYSADRQALLDRLLIEPARRLANEAFVVAGSKYPADLRWPPNVTTIAHAAPDDHPAFYAAQRFTLNITRADMRRLGYSPSVRLFEAAACGVPIISDRWPGLETIFAPGEEILVADDSREIIGILTSMPEERRCAIAAAARKRLLREHTPDHRARQLEAYYLDALEAQGAGTAPAVAADL